MKNDISCGTYAALVREIALITAQLFLGFRISEILSLCIHHVWQNGSLSQRVALPPRFLKGGRGATRSVPIGPELARALTEYLARLSRHSSLNPEEPLFQSPRLDSDGTRKSIGRSMAEKIIKRALRSVSKDPQGLSTHSLRKSWALRLYEASGRDLLVVRDGLGHASVAITQVYLPTSRSRVEDLILKSDWTHRRPRRAAPPGAAAK